MLALLEFIAAVILWGAALVLAQFGIEADFARPTAAVHAPAHEPPHPRETPASCPGRTVARTVTHDV